MARIERPINPQMDEFFARIAQQDLALTYDDVRLDTSYSDVMPDQVVLDTYFSRRIPLRVPIVSAAMDTVTESKLAIAMAISGGIGVIHKNMSASEQAEQVARVKHHLSGRLIGRPICVDAAEKIGSVLRRRARKGYTFHSFPVLENNVLVGLLTRSDFEFALGPKQTARDAMTPLEDLITAPGDTTREQAYELMRRHKRKILPLVAEDGSLAGLYTYSDLKRILSGTSLHNVDRHGRLLVAAAVGVGKRALTHAKALAASEVDAFVVDTAHAASLNVVNTIKQLRELYPHIDTLAGNVSNGKSAMVLREAGADGILVGQGGGSICTTRVVAGVGRPQLTAVYDVVNALRGSGIPICADGGITCSGDVALALAIGADSVMLGRALAGTSEAPGEEYLDDKGRRMKVYRGMASASALRDNPGSRQRYRESGVNGIVPEGIEGGVLFVGAVRDVLHLYVTGVKKSCGYQGAPNLDALVAGAKLFRITAAGLNESRPHDVQVTSN